LLCRHSAREPFVCGAAGADAVFGFVVTSAGCWNYAALVGSTVTLSIALLVTCVIALVVWRRRRAATSSGSRSRLPSISLPSLRRSRPPRFNRLVNEAEFQSVRPYDPQPATRARTERVSSFDCLQAHADEQRSLMGSDAASGGGDRGAQDGDDTRGGHTFIDIFGDEDQSSMSFVTNRPQVRLRVCVQRLLACPPRSGDD
jgi:hypothetical protein